jgi:hypothetical protein
MKKNLIEIKCIMPSITLAKPKIFLRIIWGRIINKLNRPKYSFISEIMVCRLNPNFRDGLSKLK